MVQLKSAAYSMREGKTLRTVAATNDLVRRLNTIEHELDEGPCMQAVLEHRSYRIDMAFRMKVSPSLAHHRLSRWRAASCVGFPMPLERGGDGRALHGSDDDERLRRLAQIAEADREGLFTRTRRWSTGGRC
jgi:hypothetical protein